jgi:sec-independent protein translocase protein TatA
MPVLTNMLHPALFSLGTSELLLILVAVLIVFGPSNLPKLADAMGKAMKNFRKAASGEETVEPKKDDPPKQ